MAGSFTYGGHYMDSVYRDAARLVVNSTSSTAISSTPFLAKATVEAAVADAKSGEVNGWIIMGPADGVHFMFLGTDANNENYNYRVSAVSPMVEPDASGNLAVVAYTKTILLAGAAVLSTITAGAAGGAATGVDSTDLVADLATTLTLTTLPATYFTSQVNTQTSAHGVSVTGDNSSAVCLRTPVMGAPYVLVETQVTTAARAKVVVCRMGGHAFPSPR